MLGNSATGAMLILNDTQASSGRLGIVLAKSSGGAFAAGRAEVIELTFCALSDAAGDSAVSFGNDPVLCQVCDGAASALDAAYVPGTVTVYPPPSLLIARAENELILSWPLWATNFVLQTVSGTLNATTVWTNLPVAATVTNDCHQAVLPLTDAPRFYRLRKE
jgi:hypothetical protein